MSKKPQNPAAPKVEALTDDDLDAVSGGNKLGDHKIHDFKRRDKQGVVLSSESQEPSVKQIKDGAYTFTQDGED